MTIVSESNKTYKEFLKLKLKKYRKESGLFLAEGNHLVKEASRAGCLEAVIATRPYPGHEENTYVLSEPLFNKLSDLTTPQGVIGLCRIPGARKPGARILILDGVNDPGNLGTLIRSAKAFGFDSIVCENTVDVYGPKVVRSSQGTLFGLNFIQAEIKSFMDENRDYLYIGTDVRNGIALDEYVPSSDRIALILGNEATGVRDGILAMTDVNIRIEMKDTESLNVGVAGGIIMYRLRG